MQYTLLIELLHAAAGEACVAQVTRDAFLALTSSPNGLPLRVTYCVFLVYGLSRMRNCTELYGIVYLRWKTWHTSPPTHCFAHDKHFIGTFLDPLEDIIIPQPAQFALSLLP